MRFHRIRALGLIVGLLAVLGIASVAASETLSDQQISRQIERRLSKDDALQNVTVSVRESVVRLSGTVPSLWAKEEAIEEARELTDVQSVVSALEIERAESDVAIVEQIAKDLRRVSIPGPAAALRLGASAGSGIAAPDFSFDRNRRGFGIRQNPFGFGRDRQLLDELERAIHGTGGLYGIFDFLGGRVDNGVVTLTGYVTWEYKASQIARLVSRVHGVQEIQNQIEVLPASPVDNQLRVSIATEIYRHPVFDRYAIQVHPPIHIIVKNSHVTLTGVVLSEVEKRLAGTIARQTFGVLTFQNNLEVQGKTRSEG